MTAQRLKAGAQVQADSAVESWVIGVVAQRLSVARLGGFASVWPHLNGLLKFGGPPLSPSSEFT